MSTAYVTNNWVAYGNSNNSGQHGFSATYHKRLNFFLSQLASLHLSGPSPDNLH